MSRAVDQRVVEMRFDNRHFEQNVNTTMSSLDKLKQKLQFKNAEKGLDNLDKSVKKVDMTHLDKGVETVQAKFSALSVVGATALANLTNSAVNAGKRIVSALTIDPVRTGFSEYELKMNSIQTIMASTGESLETVNKYLNELNEYSDKTIYSFSDMTQNIGKFTNAGVKLEDAVAAIKGVSNVAAVSGANANEASRAMYNFAQALSSGYIKLIDWKSIELANMGTVEFKQQLIDAAVAAGTLTDAGNGMYKTLKGNTLNATKNFNETLTDQWMTTEVLVNTLRDYSDETTEIGKKASKAATRVTTFSKMLDTLKETAQSGWARTWELIFGDFEEGTNLWTSMNDVISGVIGKIDDFRNNLLEGALGKTFTNLSKKIEGLLGPVKGASKAIENITDVAKDYNKVVDEIIAGKWGNAPTRWQELTAAGYDWAHAQNLVNERLGDGTRHATNYAESQKNVNKAQDEGASAQGKMTEADAKRLAQLTELSDAELKSLGYTKDQIKAIRELKKEADKLGIPVDEFIKRLDELSGRTILLDSFKNIGQGLAATLGSIRDAWEEIFPPMTSDQLYNIIAGFHKFSTHLTMSDETADKLKRTFKGLFAILDIVFTLVGGPLKIAFKIIGQILGAFDMDILSVTAAVGDAIVKFRDWLDGVLDFTKIFKIMLPGLKKMGSAISDWAVKLKIPEFFKNLIPNLQKTGSAIADWAKKLKVPEFFGSLVEKLKQTGSALFDWIAGLKEADNIPLYIIQGLVKGLGAGLSLVFSAVKSLGEGILTTICEILGIHSPSKEFEDIGSNIMLGLLNGLKDGVTMIWDFISGLGQSLINIVSNLDFGQIFASVMGAGMLLGLNKMLNIISQFGQVAEGLGDMFEGVGSFLTDLGQGLEKNLKANALQKKSKALLNLAIAIGILAAAAFLLSKMEWAELGKAGVALLGLVGVMFALAGSSKLLGQTEKEITKMGGLMIKLGIAIGVMALAIKQLSFLDADNIGPILEAFGAMSKLMVAVMLINKIPVDTKGTGGMLMGVAAVLLVMAHVVKSLGKLDEKQMQQGLECITCFMLLIGALMAITKIPGVMSIGLGAMFAGIAAAILAMGIVVKMFAEMKTGDIWKGIGAIAAFAVLIGGLIAVNNLTGGSMSKGMAGTFMGVSVALLAMAASVKILASIDTGAMWRGVAAIAIFSVLIGGLLLVAQDGKKTAGLGMALLGVSAALIAMAAVVAILGFIPEENLKKGVEAVVVLGILIGILISVSGEAKGAMKGILAITAAILAISATVIVLSFLDPAKLTGATICLSVLMTILTVMIGLSSKAENAMKGMLGIAAVILALGITFKLMADIDMANMAMSTVALSVLLAEIAVILNVLSNMNSISASAMVALGVMTILISVLGNALAGLAKMEPGSIMTAAIGIAGAMLALAASMKIVASIGSISASALGALGVMTLAIGVLAGALWLIGTLKIKEVLTSSIALSVLMLALAASMKIVASIGSISASALGALGVMTLAIGVLAGALWLIGSLPIDNILASSISLSLLMVSLAGSMLIVSQVGASAIAGAAAMVVMAAAIAILSPSLQALGGMSLAEVGTGLLAIAGAFLVIGVAGAVLGPIAPMIMLLGAAIAMIGVSCLAAGLGLQTIATGLMMLAAIGPASITTLLAAVIAGIPMLIAAIGQGIIQFAMIIAAGAPAIANAVISVLTAMLIALQTTIPVLFDTIRVFLDELIPFLIEYIPKFVEVLKVMLDELIALIVEYVPKLVEAGMQIILGILEGIAAHIGDITATALEIIANFILGIAEGLPGIIDAAFKLIISFINGLADAITNNADALYNAVEKLITAILTAIGKFFGKIGEKGKELVGKLIEGIKKKVSDMGQAAKDLIDGLIKGLKDMAKKVKDTLLKIIGDAVDGILEFLGIKSPSRLFRKIGRYADEGLIIGLKKYSDGVYDAGTDVAEAALTGLTDYLGVNSPAKEGIKVGMFLTEGFAIGMQALQGTVHDAGTVVGSISAEGITEGIKADTTAEKAAEQKAKNIANAFKKTTKQIDESEKTIELKYALKLVSDDEYNDRQIKFQGDRIANAWAEYLKNVEVFGEGAKESIEAYNKYLQELVDMDDLTKDQITKKFDEIFSQIDNSEKTIDLKYQFGLISEDDYYDKQVKFQEDRIANARDEYLKTVEVFGKDAKESVEAYNKYLQELVDMNDLTNDRFETTMDNREANLSRAESLNNLEYEIWTKLNAETATEAEAARAYLNSLRNQYNIASERLNNAQAIYESYANDSTKTAAEIEEAKIAVLEAQSSFIDAQQTLTTAQKDETERQKNALVEYNRYLSKYRTALLEQGLTNEQIEEAARKSSGYDPNITNDETIISNAKSAATTFVSTFGESVQTGSSEGVTSAAQTMVVACTDAIKEQQPSWIESGKYLVEGFIQGIRDNIESAKAAAIEVAKAVHSAVTTELKINSPSRSFMEIGRYVDEGFALGIAKYSDIATDATSGLSETVVKSMSDQISGIADFINNDIDTVPTIRPVLDLSNLQNGVNRIDGMFGQRSFALANINASIASNNMDRLNDIASRMESFNDSRNSEVVGAITELRSDFGKLTKAISGMHIRMDSKTVVGELIGKIDSSLGQITNYKGRGN